MPLEGPRAEQRGPVSPIVCLHSAPLPEKNNESAAQSQQPRARPRRYGERQALILSPELCAILNLYGFVRRGHPALHHAGKDQNFAGVAAGTVWKLLGGF